MEPANTRSAQSQRKKRAHYPLSEALTRRVINYLNGFRLFIAGALGIALLSGGIIASAGTGLAALPETAIAAYFLVGLVLAVAARHERFNCFMLAKLSLFTDILFLSLLYVVLGGLGSGLGVLLVFVSAAAAILLPLRLALFLAALATLVIVGDALPPALLGDGRTEDLVSAGLYGVTNFLTAILVHLLAFWARDYRLIAERQQLTLTRLEQINELIIRRMRGGVLAIDSQGEIQMMNESAWFLLGNPASTDRVLAEVSPELHDAFERWRREPRAEIPALTLKTSQAQVVPKFVTLPGQREVRVLIFLEDNDVIAQRALEMSSNSLAKLSGSIAHEIRNPLAAANHAAQLLSESEALPPPDRRLVDIIIKQSRRMNDIVENILQLSRREKSRPDLFELRAWLEELVEEFRAALPDKELQLECVLPEDETLVMFDRSQLHQALWKLMENAVDHAVNEDAAAEVTLRLEQQPEAGFCVVSVEDNGSGIPQDQIEQIFEPFYTTRQLGSGLGLYVARQLCEANQAELTVDSTPGWKTRFHVRLAMASQAQAEFEIEEGVRLG